MESEGSSKYQKTSIIFLDFSSAKMSYRTRLPQELHSLYLIFVLLQSDVVQGVDKAFLVRLLVIKITVLSYILRAGIFQTQRPGSLITQFSSNRYTPEIGSEILKRR